MDNNVWVDSVNKIINIAYVTRTSDFTGSRLFADIDLKGGFSPNLNQVEQIRKNTGILVLLLIFIGEKKIYHILNRIKEN